MLFSYMYACNYDEGKKSLEIPVVNLSDSQKKGSSVSWHDKYLIHLLFSYINNMFIVRCIKRYKIDPTLPLPLTNIHYTTSSVNTN